MLKEELKQNQPLFYRIIFNEFKNNKIPHAFLLNGKNISQALLFLKMSLICEDIVACEKCIDCQKIKNHQYADIIEFGLKYINQYGERENLVSSKTFVINNNHIGNLLVMFYDSMIKFMPWTKIIRRSIVETRPYNTSRTFEDIRTTPYWVYNANKIIIANTIEINYRAAANSIIRENPNETRLGTVKAISELFEDFKDNKDILKAMYDRCLVDLRTMIHINSDSDYFKEMSKLNTKMLSYIYPDDYQKRTYNVE